jgi:hypothetical protein
MEYAMVLYETINSDDMLSLVPMTVEHNDGLPFPMAVFDDDFDDEEETSCDCTNDFGDNATKAASLDEASPEE